MPYYDVRFEGRDLFVRMVESKWFGLRPRVYRQPSGFVTTRFVEAHSPEEAAERAREILIADVREVSANEPDEPWFEIVTGVWEEPSTPEVMPGSGFTFWDQDYHGQSDNQ